MKTFSHTDIEVGGFQFHITVIASGNTEHPYAVEWYKSGDKDTIRERVNFGQVHDAERWAEQQIHKKHG
jgi:hypothetical protein